MRSLPKSANLLLKSFSPLGSGFYFVMFIGMYGHGFITSLCHSLVTLLSNFKHSVVRQVSIQRHCDLDCEWVGGFLSSLSLVKRSIRVLLQAAYSRTRQMVPRNEKRPPWTPCGNSLWVVTEGKMAERELHLHQLAWADCASSGVSQTWVNLSSATY